MLSLNWDKGTTSVSDLFPVQPVLSLWDLTQGRLHVRIEQAGHLYFHEFDLHSSHSLDCTGLGYGAEAEADADASFSSIAQISL